LIDQQSGVYLQHLREEHVMKYAAVFVLALAATFAGGEEKAAPTLPTLKDGHVGYQGVVDATGAEASELHSRARAWVAAEYESFKAVTQLDDPAAGTLVIKGSFSVTMPAKGGDDIRSPNSRPAFTIPVQHVVTIDTKKGRYRYTISDLVLIPEHPNAWGPIEVWRARGVNPPEWYAEIEQLIAAACEGIVANLKLAMQKPTPAGSNW
jgi:hypothetical protein